MSVTFNKYYLYKNLNNHVHIILKAKNLLKIFLNKKVTQQLIGRQTPHFDLVPHTYMFEILHGFVLIVFDKIFN